MGQESIFNLSGETYRDKFENKMSNLAKEWYLYKHFRVGKNINNLELLHYQMFDFLCLENCELQKYINNIIEGKEIMGNTILNIPNQEALPVENITIINNNTNIINPPFEWEIINW